MGDYSNGSTSPVQWESCDVHCPTSFHAFTYIEELNEKVGNLDKKYSNKLNKIESMLDEYVEENEELKYLKEEILNSKNILLENKKEISTIRRTSKESWEKLFYNNGSQSVISQIDDIHNELKEQNHKIKSIETEVKEATKLIIDSSNNLTSEIRALVLSHKEDRKDFSIARITVFAAIAASFISLAPWIDKHITRVFEKQPIESQGTSGIR